MRPDLEAEREQRAAEAFDRIRTGQHWRDWTYIAQGFEVGRGKAMREAYTNEPVGRRYNECFSRWMSGRPWAKAIDKATRSHLMWVADHLVEIEAWRETLPANQRDAWNHPTTVKRAYERAHKMAVAKAAGEPVLSHVGQLKAALVESETERDRWKRQAEEAGSLFNLYKDSAEVIARVLVESVRPTRAESIARAIIKEVKSQKGLHAG